MKASQQQQQELQQRQRQQRSVSPDLVSKKQLKDQIGQSFTKKDFIPFEIQ
jgi:hypothetical protein